MTTTTTTAGGLELAVGRRQVADLYAAVRQAPTPPKNLATTSVIPQRDNHMFVAYTIVAGVFTVMLTMSARMKLVHDPLAVEVIGGVVGVPLRLFPMLALLELAGAVGLLIGIGVKPLGVAAGAGLVVYFIGAITSHLRKRDLVPGHLGPPIMMLVISAAALALRLAA